MEALDGEAALVVMTTAARFERRLTLCPGASERSYRAIHSVRGANATRRVLVTNGGYGTVQQALAHGVPIVVAGATEDKPETAARIAWSKPECGSASQTPGRPDGSARRFRPSVSSALPRTGTGPHREMAGYDPPAHAADLLEQLARSGAPVTAPIAERELARAGR